MSLPMRTRCLLKIHYLKEDRVVTVPDYSWHSNCNTLKKAQSLANGIRQMAVIYVTAKGHEPFTLKTLCQPK
jgi:hypothetical protein